MRFIFRNPFVTKKSKIDAATILESAKALSSEAIASKRNGNIELATVQSFMASSLMDSAAKCYGFRNIADLYLWINSGRKL